ncbi:hypothetical protein FBY35_7117 [Streptomyces sp. SLBN-118]|uniref:hypothetical protein n=1 Tax=Streptomyces sp. SLBN-118 TaxID=2768454 RepID=UPI0011668DCA|nr:hypothetical protein [Streptomyces sp. SLBN-118]TQK45544.1 hypothetical protein FBY35_7117 [Streptomyces sp. SLBN-118]
MTSPPEPPQEPASPASEGPPKSGGRVASTAGRITRKVSSAVLIVLACILVPLSVLTVWVHDIALDTDRYVETVAPLASNPDIEDAAVNRAVQAVNVRFDAKEFTSNVAAWLQSQGLPPTAAQAVRGFAPQLESAVDSAVEKVARRFVESDRFETLWTEANRAGHAAVVHALTGKGRGAIGVEEGTVTLSVGTVVDTVKKDLVDAGLQPASKIPDVNKTLVLFKSDKLAKIQDAAHALDVLGNWMPIITVLIGAAGVLLAYRRRRALAKTALGAALGCLIVAIALVIARRYYLDHLPNQVQSDAAAAAVFDTLLRFLRVTLRTVIVLGVVIALGAYLIGPGRLPVAVRATSERTADSAARWGDAHGVTTGPVGTWTNKYRRWINLGVLLLLALIFALWNNPTVLTVLLLVLILLAALAVISLLAATGRTRTPAPAGHDSLPGDHEQPL